MKKIILMFVVFILPMIVKGEELEPSFAGLTIEMEVNETKKLIDANNVLSNYEKYNISSCSIEISNNILTIKSSFQGNKGFVVLKSKKTNKQVWVYLNITAARVEITNYDKESKLPFSLIDRTFFAETKYALYNNDNKEIVNEFVTDVNGIALSKRVMPGNYCIRQITSNYGYEINTYEPCFTLNNIDGSKKLVYNNLLIKSQLEILKLYDNNPDSNISFEIYQNNKLLKTITTDTNGVANIYLNYGTYKIIQINKNNDEDFYESFITIDNNFKKTVKIANEKENTPKLEDLNKEKEIINNNQKDADYENDENKILNPYTNDSIYIYLTLFGISLILLKKYFK